MNTYKEFKTLNGFTTIKWGNCKAKKVTEGIYAGQTVQRAMAIVDSIKFYSKAGLLTEHIAKLSEEELFVYAGEKNGEPVLWLTDSTGLTGIIDK